MGKENYEADAQSRAPIDQVYRDDEYQKMINLLTKEQLIDFQKDFEMSKGRMKLNGMIVQRESGRVCVIVEGEEMVERELFGKCHDQVNVGVEKMKKLGLQSRLPKCSITVDNLGITSKV